MMVGKLKMLALATVLLCSALSLNAQKVKSGSLEALTTESSVRLEVDFGQASICNMNEKSFDEAHNEWLDEKPNVVKKLEDRLNAMTAGHVSFGDDMDSRLTLKVVVKTISKRGDWRCRLLLQDGGGETLCHVTGVRGDNRIIVGMHSNTVNPAGSLSEVILPVIDYIKDGALVTGENIGRFIMSQAFLNKD